MSWSFAPAQGLTVSALIDNGTPISGATANGVLYADAGGLLDSEAAFTYDDSTNLLTVGALTVASGQILAADGIVTLPGFAFGSAPTSSGLYKTTNGFTAAVPTTNALFRFTTGAVILEGTSSLQWSGGNPTSVAADVMLFRDAAGILAQRNGTNAQVFRVANTYTSASVLENFEINWQANANDCVLRMAHTGATLRTVTLAYANTASVAIRIPTSTSGQLVLAGVNITTSVVDGRVLIGNGGTTTATTGTHSGLRINEGYAPTGSSTLIARTIELDPTINFSAGGAGQIKLLHFNPTNTALPTGLNAACVFSSTASALGGMIFHNQTDEATNYEIGRLWYTSNVLTLESTIGGSGTIRAIRISTTGEAAVNMRTGGTDRWRFEASPYRLASVANYGFSHGTSALATSATEGFFHLQSCAGTPAGTPASIPTGQVPLCIDSTNSKFYAYLGGAWKALEVAGVDCVFV